MKYSLIKVSILFCLFFIALIPVNASASVIINEIAWMGTTSAYADEWIELYNNTNSPLNLDGWMLKATDGTPEINLVGTIRANNFYLLERTDDTTIPGIDADQIYTGALGNKGENLELYDNSDPRNLIDAVDSSSGWFAGINSTKQTMERKNSQDSGNDADNWQTSQNPGGTPKAQNSIAQPDPKPEPVCQPTEEICDGIDNDCDDLIDEDLGVISCGVGACVITTESCVGGVAQICTPGTPIAEVCDQIDNNCDGQIDEDDICIAPESEVQPQPSPKTYPFGIFINEFLPSPEGPDRDGEWIEFYNSNAKSVNLSNWIIEDGKGVTKSYTFPANTNIQSYGFLLLIRPTSKIVLNNDGEGLLLKNPLGVVVDAVSYNGKAPQGQSFAKKNSGAWDWTLSLTPGEENLFPTPVEAESELGLEPQPEPETAEESQPEPDELESQPEADEDEVAEVEAVEVKPQQLPRQLQSELLTYPAGIVINEILPSPTGSDATEEWIEIFNSNDFEINLSGWQVKDTTGRIKAYTFPKGTKISQKGYLVLSRPTTKITLNNDGDGVNLIQPNGEIGDHVSYEKAPAGKSYNRVGVEWFWGDILTPGSENIVPSQFPKKTEEEKVGSASEIQGKGVAAIGQLFPKSSQGLFTLLAAIVVAIFSGVIILILKRKTKIG